jgi:biopolymer transport protein TolR
MAQVNARHKRRRRAVADINVVPYIDVMLVLLIIFMVTAPLLNLGVKVDLPNANAKPIETKLDPVMVNVDKELYLTMPQQKVGEEIIQSDAVLIEAEALAKKLGVFVRENPDTQVLVGADEAVNYGVVYKVMALLQNANVTRVSLMSQPE